ncbi:hypothetical protein ATX70_09300 [Oenococcus oeni]|uniref:hypothetical protein n=1 Tax=Oenococcus oeni TaxID=1247 RepID=UPI0008F926C4|nr:hypothetical protein [Oenococcus oeni]OIM34745.1 hypothetical protein ATX70_09300 [Oenococcus oeni]
MNTQITVINTVLNKTLGKSLEEGTIFSGAIEPTFAYDDNNNRTDQINGYKVSLLIPGFSSMFDVKVPHKPNLKAISQVKVINPVIRVYDMRGQIGLSIKADGIEAA